MFKESGSLDNKEVYLYSDTDIPSLGSTESDEDAELPLPDDINLDTKYFKNKTPKVSRYVLECDINSSEIQKSNQKIANNIFELQKSQDQLQKLAEYDNKKDDKEYTLPTSNSQLFDKEIEQSKVKQSVYQQIKQANFQLDKVQEQLFHFFDGINKFGEIFSSNNIEITEKANKAKEISNDIQQSQANSSFSHEENKSNKEPKESFKELCTHADTIITELSSIMAKLNELLEM